mgnify:CR=1 FL=1
MTTETTATLDPTEYEVLIEDANEVGVEFAKRDKADKGRFKRDIKPDGYGVRLAQVQIAARAALSQSVGKVERLPSAMLKQLGIDKVSSALRSEWVWFVQNETSAREFIKASKKGFTNVSALKTAMAKAAKAEDKSEATDTESEVTEGETTENAATEGDTLDVSTIAVAIHALASRDGKSVEDVLSEIVDLFAETNSAAIAA